MAFIDFSEDQYIKFMDTGEEISMGSFSTAQNIELKYIRVTIYIEGAVPTTEKIRVNIYSDEDYTALLYQSDWSSLVDIEGVTSRWIGWLRVDFDRSPINKNLIYYPTIEATGYTANPGTYEIGFCYDYPFPIYENSETFFYNHPLQMQVFGYNWEQ